MRAGSLRLLIDTDPGVDDAIALMMALRHPTARVEAITVVAGNAGLENTVRNARYVVELCESDVPVYAGAAHALLREARRASEVHGDDGLGNLGLRPRNPAPAPGHAADVLIDLITRNPGVLTLVTLGPLTNVALALLREPGIAGMVGRVVMMGGAANVVGNVTPAAEFNVWADPEAARIVLRAGMPLTMVGIEVSRGAARWSEAEIAHLAEIGRRGEAPPPAAGTERTAQTAQATAPTVSERARVAAALLSYSYEVSRHRPSERGDALGASCPDGTAMTVALEPAALTDCGRYHVDVETHGDLTTGETVVDRRGVLGRPPNAAVAHAIDATRFKALVVAACR